MNELVTMRNVFRYALKYGLILSSAATTIKRPKVSFTKVVIPTREQFVKLVTQIWQSDGRADSQLKSNAGADLIEFLAFSGARIGEARVCAWDDVKFQNNMIWLRVRPAGHCQSPQSMSSGPDRLKKQLLVVARK